MKECIVESLLTWRIPVAVVIYHTPANVTWFWWRTVCRAWRYISSTMAPFGQPHQQNLLSCCCSVFSPTAIVINGFCSDLISSVFQFFCSRRNYLYRPCKDLAEKQTSHLPHQNSKAFFICDTFNCCWNTIKGQKTLMFQSEKECIAWLCSPVVKVLWTLDFGPYFCLVSNNLLVKKTPKN